MLRGTISVSTSSTCCFEPLSNTGPLVECAGGEKHFRIVAIAFHAFVETVLATWKLSDAPWTKIED